MDLTSISFGRTVLALVLSLIGYLTVSNLFKKRKSVQGQIVLITGGGSGLGRLMAHRFAKLGAIPVIWDINEEGAKKVAEECQAFGKNKAYYYKVDLSKYQDVYAVADKVKEQVGVVDILINNAGIVTGKKLLDSSEALITKTFEVNSLALFWTAKAFLPEMINRNKGHLVTISSMAGLIGVCGLADYCGSKFAAFGFHESIRFELFKTKKTGVKTTVVCPYYVNTGMFDGVKEKNFLLPILDADYAADQIVDAILTNREHLSMPYFASLIGIPRCFPVFMFDWFMRYLGVSDTMDEFKGRQTITASK